MNILIKKFIFVRHGSTDWNMSQVYLGPKDYNLNPAGIEEAKKTAIYINKYFKQLGVEGAVIISSTLNRAKKTAQIISEYNHNMPILYDLSLNERFYGTYINENIPDDLEETKNFDNRILSCITEILGKKYDNLIIVSHFGVFKSIQKALINNEKPKYINKGEAMIFTYDDTDWHVNPLSAITPELTH